MRYLLDTCVISDFIKGEPNTLARMKRTPSSDLGVSSITVMELDYGLALNPKFAQKAKPLITSFLAAVTTIPFGDREAEQAAQIRAILKSQGQPIGAYDVLIAATAVQHHLLMVTANQREFDRVIGLQTENWREL
jgi:tRNA(fMet)-specific endonuclease VapC